MARFHTRGRQHFSVGNCARPVCRDPRGAGKPLDDAGPALGVRGRRPRRDREGSCHRRRLLGATPHLRGPDGYRGLRRGRGPRLRGLRKPRLSRAARRHVAFAGRVAQRADGAVSRCARHYRGRLYRDRARRNRAGRTPPSSRLGPDFKLVPGVVRAGRVACRIRFSAADVAEASRSRPHHANAARSGQPPDRIQFDRVCQYGWCGASAGIMRPAPRSRASG